MINRRRPDDMERYILDHLDEALSCGYIKVYVQPVIRTLTRQVCGMEALARWDDPEYGLFQPGEFIGILEKHRRIHELDTFVLRRVCENYSSVNSFLEVPVSINLSRLDYELCDIFEIVEETVMTYKMPRSDLCIEITESVLASNETLMKKYIERFQAAGYGVWMDDFGSGYSSLNVLKDYMFDELKIDMRFLSVFNTRSKTILASIIHMAKQINIQTLAEGVETEEQFEYLRNIGCEKVQGFLFSEPVPYEHFLEKIIESGMTVESPKLRRYYDTIGNLNVMSATPFKTFTHGNTPITGRELNSIPLALLELRGDAAAMFFANQAFEKSAQAVEWPLLWNSSLDIAYVPLDMIPQRLQRLIEETRVDGESNLLSVYNDDYYEMRALRLAQHENHCAILISMTNLSQIAAMDSQKLLDDGLRSLYSLYEQVSLISLKNHTVLSLHLRHDSEDKLATGDLQTQIEEYAEQRLFPEDKERFRHFMCPETLESRATKGSGISIHLRVRTFHGVYSWKCFLLVRIREDNYYLLIRDAEAEVRELQSTYHADSSSEDKLTPELLWENVVNSADMKFFWKDRNRRFVGASRRFMEHYHFQSVLDFAGKTDEEMGWHIHPDLYRNEEWKVLNEGITSHRVDGNCLIQGEDRKIVASKMPLFNRDGKIVGLIGYFYQADDNAQEVRALRQARADTLTGLLNSRGIYEDMHAYLDEYELRGQDFARIEVLIDDFSNINARYGFDFGDAVIRETGKMLLEACGNTATVGRISGCCFTVVRQFETEQELSEVITAIRQIPSKLRQVDDVPFSLYLSVGMARFSESKNLDTMAGQAEMRCLTDDVEGISQRQLMENTSHIFQMFDELPLSYAVYKVLSGSEGADAIVLYVNKRFTTTTRIMPENLIGKRVSHFFRSSPEDWLALAVEAGLEGKTVKKQGWFESFNCNLAITAHPVIGPGFCAFTFQKMNS